jgi:hypothetical protein
MNIRLGIRRDVPYPRIEDTGYRRARKRVSTNDLAILSFPSESSTASRGVAFSGSMAFSDPKAKTVSEIPREGSKSGR